MRSRAALAVVGVVAGTLPPAAQASTLQETVRLGPGGAGVRQILPAPGERHVVRRMRAALAKPGRATRRRSLLYFAQLTDPHTVDEMSPGRVEFLDPAGKGASHGHRPQEAFSAQVLDQIVRAVNRHAISEISGARMALSLMTGDVSDNAQVNETRTYIRTLEGGPVDPFSGKPIGPGNRCPGAKPEEVSRLNAAVAARRYTGVQDHSDYPDAPAGRRNWFWDPDTGAQSGRYRGVRYPGLLDRAQQPFAAEGLATPWFATRGNHDSFKQGVASTRHPFFFRKSAGCRKVFPGVFDPRRFRNLGQVQLLQRLGARAALAAARRDVRLVPPDPDRRPISKQAFKRAHGTEDRGHGFRTVARSQNRGSRGAASYYAFTPRRGFRFISLDSVAEAGGPSGNIDHPQYRWLARELDRNSSVSLPDGRGRVRRDRDPNRLIVVFAHHTLGTMNNPRHDERAGRCTRRAPTGCDADPRRSRPLHLGLGGNASVRRLLLRYPNVVAMVVGHSHRNHVGGYSRADGRGGFWQLNTASHIDFPQQSRLIELMDNRDGTLSIFGTQLDHAAPFAAPRPGTQAANIGDAGLASLSRALSAPAKGAGTGLGTSRGRRIDRNVELLLRNPRRLAR
jgi:metallophosphoesterase (TIGR03767 family)